MSFSIVSAGFVTNPVYLHVKITNNHKQFLPTIYEKCEAVTTLLNTWDDEEATPVFECNECVPNPSSPDQLGC